MENIGLGGGLAALAFWGFIASVVVASIWEDARKREAQHETVRRLIDSGQAIDQTLVDKLLSLTGNDNKRYDREFTVTGMWLLPVAIGLSIFALILGIQAPAAKIPLLGTSALLACIAIGALAAGRISRHWYASNDDLANSQED